MLPKGINLPGDEWFQWRAYFAKLWPYKDTRELESLAKRMVKSLSCLFSTTMTEEEYRTHLRQFAQSLAEEDR